MGKKLPNRKLQRAFLKNHVDLLYTQWLAFSEPLF
jgi:hypothetical protein